IFGEVDGDININGSNSSDSLQLDEPDPTLPLTINGRITVNFGPGGGAIGDKIAVGLISTNPVTLNNTVNFTTGNGGDDLEFQNMVAGADMTLNMGDGNNSVDFGSSIPDAVGGNLRITGGTGNDDLATSFHVAVGGDLNVNLGEGSNSLTFGTGSD